MILYNNGNPRVYSTICPTDAVKCLFTVRVGYTKQLVGMRSFGNLSFVRRLCMPHSFRPVSSYLFAVMPRARHSFLASVAAAAEHFKLTSAVLVGEAADSTVVDG